MYGDDVILQLTNSRDKMVDALVRKGHDPSTALPMVTNQLMDSLRQNGGIPENEIEQVRAIMLKPRTPPAEPSDLEKETMSIPTPGYSQPKQSVAPTEFDKIEATPVNSGMSMPDAGAPPPAPAQPAQPAQAAQAQPVRQATAQPRARPAPSDEMPVAPTPDPPLVRATRAAYEAQTELQRRQQDQARAVEQQRMETEAENQRLLDKSRAETDKVIADFDKAREELATRKIDPRKAYEAGFGSNVVSQTMIAIGLMFGARSAARTGGQNVPLQMINKAIDTELLRQEKAIESGRYNLDAQTRHLEMLRRKHGDLGLALAEKKALAMAQTSALLQGKVDIATNAASRAEGIKGLELVNAQLEEKKQALKSEAANRAVQLQISREKNATDIAIHGAEQGQRARAASAEQQREIGETELPGRGVSSKPKLATREWKEVHRVHTQAEELDWLLGEMIAIRNRSSISYSEKDINDLKAYNDKYGAIMRSYTGTGSVLAKEEIPGVFPMNGWDNLTNFKIYSDKGKLEKTRALINKSADKYLRAYGYPARQAATPVPRGSETVSP